MPRNSRKRERTSPDENSDEPATSEYSTSDVRRERVTIVRAEGILMSGSPVRTKMRFARFLNKRTNTNPKKGPIHHRSPAKVFYRCVRGMVPHKMKRGECAMSRLTCFDGCPSPYDKKKRVIVPKALKVIRMEKSRNFSNLGDLLAAVVRFRCGIVFFHYYGRLCFVLCDCVLFSLRFVIFCLC